MFVVFVKLPLTVCGVFIILLALSGSFRDIVARRFFKLRAILFPRFMEQFQERYNHRMRERKRKLLTGGIEELVNERLQQQVTTANEDEDKSEKVLIELVEIG